MRVRRFVLLVFFCPVSFRYFFCFVVNFGCKTDERRPTNYGTRARTRPALLRSDTTFHGPVVSACLLICISLAHLHTGAGPLCAAELEIWFRFLFVSSTFSFLPVIVLPFFFVILSLFFYLFQFWINDNRVAPLASTEFRSRCARFFFFGLPIFRLIVMTIFFVVVVSMGRVANLHVICMSTRKSRHGGAGCHHLVDSIATIGNDRRHLGATFLLI